MTTHGLLSMKSPKSPKRFEALVSRRFRAEVTNIVLRAEVTNNVLSGGGFC